MCELIFGLSSFTSGLNAVKYANCVKQTYRVNTKKKKTHVYLSSTLDTSLALSHTTSHAS